MLDTYEAMRIPLPRPAFGIDVVADLPSRWFIPHVISPSFKAGCLLQPAAEIAIQLGHAKIYHLDNMSKTILATLHAAILLMFTIIQ